MPYVLTAGFLLGIGFGWLFFRPSPHTATEPAAVVATEAKPATKPVASARPAAGSLVEVERFFLHWGGYAVWENDVTEIALWNEASQRYDRFYEIVRTGGQFYFRTLSRLRRPLRDHGARCHSPIWFTETQAMRDEFYRNNPGYKPNPEPVVDLPPRPPLREEIGLPAGETLHPAGSDILPPPPPLTPGAGG